MSSRVRDLTRFSRSESSLVAMLLVVSAAQVATLQLRGSPAWWQRCADAHKWILIRSDELHWSCDFASHRSGRKLTCASAAGRKRWRRCAMSSRAWSGL